MLADKTKAVLLQEMAHRTKNNLAILSGTNRLEARHGGPEVAAALEATARRIQDGRGLRPPRSQAGVAHRRYALLPNDVVHKVFQPLAPSAPVAFQVLCEEFSLPHATALAIGIIANELVTNSLKYGFSDERSGHITVELSKTDEIELSVSDNGIGLTAAAEPGGLGSRIVQLLAQQLEGEIAYERLNPGLRVRVRARSG